ncbi:MAG: 16S rRNA (uracil(1498)-N(3))-methyltransferase, partial [Bdellovibrionales bacterium]|nr:16S rRNA (uracil(1498)-N(3))-methyltransferase [Bdellovibrionales bacterium]
MRRFWISTEDIRNDQVQFKDDAFHHIFVVCREELGSKFEVLTGTPIARLVEVTSVSKKAAVGRVLSERPLPEIAKPHIILAVGYSRPQKMDWIIEKAVELGVHRVVPVLSEFSFLRSKSEAMGRHHRYEKIIRAATEQSGRGSLMELSDPEGLEGLLQTFNRDGRSAGLFPYEGTSDLNLTNAITRLKPQVDQASLDEVWLFVGSEGGFSQREVEAFRAVGLPPVTAGSQILRVETACVVLVGVLKYGLGL